MSIISIDPYRPREVVAEVNELSLSGLQDVLAAAADGAESWRSASAMTRSAILSAIARDLEGDADRLARLVTREVGKPISEARGEVARTVAITRYFAQAALLPDGETIPSADGATWVSVRRRPRGVIAVVTPWNFPLAIPAWKSMPALAFGNAVVLKPASAAIGSALALAEIIERHVPASVFTLAPGEGELGSRIIEASEVDAATFTGSTRVGQMIVQAAAARGVPVQAEMGGQNAGIVLADADIDRAVSMMTYSAFSFAGQKCTATRRILVDRSILPQLRDALLKGVDSLVVGDPEDEATVVGPVISAAARDEIHDAINRSVGTVLAGGSSSGSGPGFHVEPTVVEVTDLDDPLATEEVFGPVVALVATDGPENALEVANSLDYGLSAAVYTNDLRAASVFVDGLEAGMVKVNGPTAGVDFHAPFGGMKQSSYGPREQGMAARDFFTESRTISITP